MGSEAAAALIQGLARGRKCQPRANPGVPPMQSLQWLASPAIVERVFDACNVAPGTRKRYLDVDGAAREKACDIHHLTYGVLHRPAGNASP
jgi:hypothetical protein